ncbi:hypothetical protein MPER_11662 [Moniliophthora perniciosa FA553]|nr:hypothetical protein MPER_11662 [Moniliophthora perniciosa FA553]
MAFHKSSDFAIHDGTFNNVGRDQHYYMIHGNMVTSREHVGQRDRFGGALTVWDQYQELLPGHINLKKKIGETSVKGQGRKWEKLEACRNIHIASVRGEDRDSEFLYISYTGPDAIKACELDLEDVSRNKSLNYIQLFGYHQTEVPALIFYGAHLPITYIWARIAWSPLLRVYFECLFGAARISGSVAYRELWLEPKTNALHRGPYVEYCPQVNYYADGVWPTLAANNGHPSPTLSSFNNTSTLFNYLVNTVSLPAIIKGLRLTYTQFAEWLSIEDTVVMLSSQIGTIYHRTSREVVAQSPEADSRWCYELHLESIVTPDVMQKSKVVMDSGLIRCV